MALTVKSLGTLGTQKWLELPRGMSESFYLEGDNLRSIMPGTGRQLVLYIIILISDDENANNSNKLLFTLRV